MIFFYLLLYHLSHGYFFYLFLPFYCAVKLLSGSGLYSVFVFTQASKIKGCEALAQWIQPIRNHFWHCAEACGGDVTKLKVLTSQITCFVCADTINK